MRITFAIYMEVYGAIVIQMKMVMWSSISGGKSLHYACIHRAARRHFYGDNCGIERPRFPYHKISYIYRDDSGDYRAAWNYLGGNAVPDIRIYGTGYSSRTIQKCLKGVTTVSNFKSNIKGNAPRGVTDRKIDMFFKTFEDRWNW